MKIAGVVLSAGEGRRLRPITERVPKALCPVGNIPLLDRALSRLARHGLRGPAGVAVNACYRADLVTAHVGNRAFRIVEPGPPLGTAGGVANLKDWIAGRAALVGNADAYLAPRVADSSDVDVLRAGWDGSTVRVLCVPATDGHRAEFGTARFAGFCLLPADVVAGLPRGHDELVHAVWRPAERAGRLEIVMYDGFYLDTGTVADFLAANLHAAGAGSLVAVDAVVTGEIEHTVVGSGAVVQGSVTRSMIFPDAYVGPDEVLVDAIRVGSDLTVTARVDPTPMSETLRSAP